MKKLLFLSIALIVFVACKKEVISSSGEIVFTMQANQFDTIYPLGCLAGWYHNSQFTEEFIKSHNFALKREQGASVFNVYDFNFSDNYLYIRILYKPYRENKFTLKYW